MGRRLLAIMNTTAAPPWARDMKKVNANAGLQVG